LWRRHIKTSLGDLRVEDVTPAAIKKLLRSIVAAGHGTTANRVRSLLRQVFNFAISEGRIERNPIDKVLALGTETARARVLSDAELKTIWGALVDPPELRKPPVGEEPGDRVYIGEPVTIALRLLFLTLARRAEVAGMRRDELDLTQSVWTIPGERTKNGVALLVPLSTSAKTLITEAIRVADEGQEKPSEFVFPSPRDRARPITPEALSHSVRDLRIALGIANTRTHDFRRTAASLMVSERLSITPFIVGRILNHTTETGGAAAVTHKHYAVHDYGREKRLALQSWADLLTAIIEGRDLASNVTPIAGSAA
jgi:integrase